MVRALLAFVALTIAYWLFAAHSPHAVGLWQDDGIYVVTARAIADGRGYRHAELPGEPWQTKYPPLYPALLAAVFSLNPAYPANLPWLHLPTAAAAAALVVLSSLYMRRVFGASRNVVIIIVLLAATSPAIVSFVRFTMSDLAYGALAIGALCCIDAKRPAHHSRGGFGSAAALDATTGRRSWVWLIAAAALVAAAMLTRSIGVSLALAVGLVLLARRRWADFGLFAATVLALVSPWWLWRAAAAAANAKLSIGLLEKPELSYDIWLPNGLSEIVRIAWQNFWRSLFGLGYFQLALPESWAKAALRDGGWTAAGWATMCALAALLIFVGFVRSLRTGWRALHIYALLYAVMVLAWPFEPYRFLIPFTPLLLYWLVSGAGAPRTSGAATPSDSPQRRAANQNPARECGARPTTRVLGSDPRRRLNTNATWVVCLLLLAVFVYEDARLIRSTPAAYHFRETPLDLAELYALEDWIAANTPAEAILASPHAAGLFLATGRRGQSCWPDTDPYALYYGRDRRWAQFYVAPAASEVQHLYQDISAEFERIYATAGIQYLILHPRIGMAYEPMQALMKQHPDWFQPVFATPKQDYTVYRVRLPAGS